jgi:molecular chaperone GrpE (heat shock protein)
VAGLEAITRATGENTQLLAKLDKASSEVAEPLQQLPVVVAELQGVIEKKDALSKQMFDALHEELRGYKDGFLLESVHRPMIRDLITLYDDASEIHRQMQAALVAESDHGGGPMWDRLKTIEVNVQHNLDFILEVLARLEVAQLPVGTGKLDKRTQRTLAVEITENPEEDMDVVQVVKRGFLWRERVVRPEEVIVKKWKEGFLVALQSCK